jgi:hypothetical protein
MNGTVIVQNPTHDPAPTVGAVLWLHITISLVAAIVLFPLIFILKYRRHNLKNIVEITCLILIASGTILGLLQRNNFYSVSHSRLGYLVALLSEIYLACDVWSSGRQFDSSWQTLRSYHISSTFKLALPVLMYIEVVLGCITVFVPSKFYPGKAANASQVGILRRTIHATMLWSFWNRELIPALFRVLGSFDHHR